MTTPIGAGLSYFDLQFLGRPHVIATALLTGAGGAALLDPGPSTTLPTLRRELAEAGLAVGDITAVLLTHIHLDHAGVTGVLLRENPQIRVFVHEVGAPHMVNPDKLLASAARLYGDQMDRLWGEVAPVPGGAIVPLKGGERLDIAGSSLRVAYTPGHASHHVSFLAESIGCGFVGDTAGVRPAPEGFILPPTPPPDIDVEVWKQSAALIDSWGADSLFITHFGTVRSPRVHLSDFCDRLDRVASLARQSLARDEGDEAREAWFAQEIRRELRRHMSEADAVNYETASPLYLNWRGLARYWKKRGEASTSPTS